MERVRRHLDPETWGPERAEQVYRDWIPQMSALIQREGSGVELWANELGYADWRFSGTHASKWGGTVFYRHEHTSAYAADFPFKSEVIPNPSQMKGKIIGRTKEPSSEEFGAIGLPPCFLERPKQRVKLQHSKEARSESKPAARASS